MHTVNPWISRCYWINSKGYDFSANKNTKIHAPYTFFLFLIIFLQNELVKINLIVILALSPLGLERQWCVPSISMSCWQLLPFWKWNWICFENFAYIRYFAVFSLYMTFKMLSFLQKFLKLILLLLGKNNSSNIANTASTTTNTLVNTAAGVEDLNIIQVTIPGVYTVWCHIILFCAYILHDICLVWWSFFLQSSWFTEIQVQSTKSII